MIAVSELGIVVRTQPLTDLKISIDRLCQVLEFDRPLDESESLISFGPCFGREASEEFCRRLQKLGLQYIDDFFVFEGDFPEWCSFRVALNDA